MKALVDAVVAKIQNTSNLALFAGVSPDGIAGPFGDIAPERTNPPYMTLKQIPGLPLQHGYGANYTELVQLQFDCQDFDRDTAIANAEALCNVFDVLPSLTLAGGQITRKPIRKEAVKVLTEQIAGTGQRMYHAISVYTFKVQRTKGS
jgi:hypothetical protein